MPKKMKSKLDDLLERTATRVSPPCLPSTRASNKHRGKNQMKINRRDFVKVAGAATAVGLVGVPHLALGAAKKVVIVGGGTGGATAAKYIKMADSSIDVTVIEPNKDYHTCYMSNEVLGGDRAIDSIRVGYDGLKGHGINVVQRHGHRHRCGRKEGQRPRVARASPFDRCIVAPGIDFKCGSHRGLRRGRRRKAAARLEGRSADRDHCASSSKPWRTAASWSSSHRRTRSAALRGPTSGPARSPCTSSTTSPSPRSSSSTPSRSSPSRASSPRPGRSSTATAPTSMIEWRPGPDAAVVKVDAAT